MFLICSTISLHFYDRFTPLLLSCIYSAYTTNFTLSFSEYIELIMINCYRLLLWG